MDNKTFDGIIIGVFMAIVALSLILIIDSIYLEPIIDDSMSSNDQDVIEASPESLQSPIFDGKFKYLANNGDIFEREVAQSNVNKGDAEINESVQDAGTKSASTLTNVRITYYCNCEQCCGPYAGGPTSSGRMPEAGRTIAASRDFIQPGSIVTIFGRDYVVEDTGPCYGVIDIFVNNHEEAIERGIQITDVEVKHYGW